MTEERFDYCSSRKEQLRDYQSNVSLEIIESPYSFYRAPCFLCGKTQKIPPLIVCFANQEPKHFICHECIKKIDPIIYEGLIVELEQWDIQLCIEQGYVNNRYEYFEKKGGTPAVNAGFPF